MRNEKWVTKELTRDARKARDESTRQLVREAKSKPCMDCHREYPSYVMQFDHARGTKRFELSQAVKHSQLNVLVEIDKCDVVCANCHAIRTYNRRTP